MDKEAFFDGMAEVFFAIEELREALRELPFDAAKSLWSSVEALHREADALVAAQTAEALRLTPALHPRASAARRGRTAS